MLQWFVEEDLVAFRHELDGMVQSIAQALGPVRRKMLTDGEIRNAPIGLSTIKLGAIDSASVPVALGEVMTVISLAVHYQPDVEPRHIGNRRTGFNDEAFKHLSNALRLHGELSLMSSSQSIAIADNSWWSYLMDSNKLITAYNKLSANNGRETFRDLYEDCFHPDDGLFVQAVENPYLIAMSKTGSSKSTSKRYGYSQFFQVPVSDLALFSNLLQPGEYTKPRLLKEATDGSFGVEQRGWSERDVSRIRSRFEGRDGLHVTFFKPWVYKKAYRIEFGYETFGKEDDMHNLLAAIQEDTQHHGIIEPVSQMYADRLAKQVSALAQMYGTINMPFYSEILFQTRTN
jgi:hypothetical protein